MTTLINKVFIDLQGKNLLVYQQKLAFKQLAADINTMMYVEDPLEEDEIKKRVAGWYCVYGRFSISFDNMEEIIYDRGLFIRRKYDALNEIDKERVGRAVARLILFIVDGLIRIQSERDSQNHSADDMPPILPHELVKLSTGQFGITILERHLQLSWSAGRIAQIERDHQALIIAHHNDPFLQSAFHTCNEYTTFEKGWAMVDGKFLALRDFCGGIATVFANTASVESDFSILGWEKDEYRTSLTDLSLEGIMQAKQHELLKSLILAENKKS